MKITVKHRVMQTTDVDIQFPVYVKDIGGENEDGTGYVSYIKIVDEFRVLTINRYTTKSRTSYEFEEEFIEYIGEWLGDYFPEPYSRAQQLIGAKEFEIIVERAKLFASAF